ncbi:MAG: hypothetical protein WA702_28825 [Bradyrhizobium sp.]|jgi:hypothetical protein
MIDKTLARMIDESLPICRQSDALLRRKQLETCAHQAHLVLIEPRQSMIRKSGNRFSEKIMLNQEI